MKRYLTIELSRRQKLIVQLKASLAGLSINEFVTNTIDEFDLQLQEDVICSCGGETTSVLTSHDIDLALAEGGTLRITGFPQHRCLSCGELMLDAFAYEQFKKLLEIKVNEWMREFGRIPNFVDFEEFLKMH